MSLLNKLLDKDKIKIIIETEEGKSTKYLDAPNFIKENEMNKITYLGELMRKQIKENIQNYQRIYIEYDKYGTSIEAK